MGSIVKRAATDRKTGKKHQQFYIVFYTGERRWSEKANRFVPQQKWEKVPPELNTQRGAAKFLAQREVEIQQGTYETRGKTHFADVAHDWLQNEVKPTAKPTTIERYETILRNHLLPTFGAMFVEAIRPRDVQAFVAHKVADGLANRTIQHQVSVLRLIVRKAVEWEVLRANPIADVRIRYPQAVKRENNPLSPEEVRLFLDHTPEHWYPFFVFAIWSGMRLGEILAAKWDYLDWTTQRYAVRETLSRKRVFGSPKTTGSAALVPLSSFVVETLKPHRQRQIERRLAVGGQYQDYGLIFPTAKGTPTFHETINKGIFKRILKEAGLRDIRFHDLRHTCASLMIKNGETPKAVQRQLRHASIKITLDTYGHLFPEDEDGAVARLDQLIWEQ